MIEWHVIVGQTSKVQGQDWCHLSPDRQSLMQPGGTSPGPQYDPNRPQYLAANRQFEPTNSEMTLHAPCILIEPARMQPAVCSFGMFQEASGDETKGQPGS